MARRVTWLRSLIVLLAVIDGGYMLVDGIHALATGDYITPSSGQLGPWTHAFEAIGLAPRSPVVEVWFAAFGALWLGATIAFVARARWHRGPCSCWPSRRSGTSCSARSSAWCRSRCCSGCDEPSYGDPDPPWGDATKRVNRRSREHGAIAAVLPRMKPILALVLAATTACVSNGTYNKKVAELTKAREDDDAAAAAREKALQGQLDGAQKNYMELQSKLVDVQSSLDAASTDKSNLQKQLDDGTQLVSALKGRLEKLGQNVDSLVKEKGQLTQAMSDAALRLEELRKQKAASDARAATFKNLVAKLHSMIDSGQLKVVLRGGRMIIALPNDILFDSGSTSLKPAGKAALGNVAAVLAAVPDRNFLVAGHTDNVPIKTELFPSNWELSTRRAVEVVHLLVADGMSPKTVAAAGYGEFDPVAANDTVEHRAQNRRIEIVLQPNLSDLPPMDDLAKGP